MSDTDGLRMLVALTPTGPEVQLGDGEEMVGLPIDTEIAIDMAANFLTVALLDSTATDVRERFEALLESKLADYATYRRQEAQAQLASALRGGS